MGAILVVDDEEIILDMIKQALSRHGCTVETATTGKEGIEKYENGDFDMVITDICMPGTDGLDVLKHIRSSNRKTTPIVGISGTPWLLEGSDFDSILPKPFSLKVLYETVDKFASQTFKRAAVG